MTLLGITLLGGAAPLARVGEASGAVLLGDVDAAIPSRADASLLS